MTSAHHRRRSRPENAIQADMRFGALRYVADLGRKSLGTYSQRRWLMRCDCGVEKEMSAQSVRRGRSTSCGCRINTKTSRAKGELTIDFLRRVLAYDPETGLFTRRAAVDGRKVGVIAGRICKDGYWRVGIARKTYTGHRLAWFYIHGAWPARDIDHKDGNRSNNTMVNLRLCTQAQNNANARCRSDNTSGYKGVTRYRGKWLAQICCDGRCIHIGKFERKEDAAAAYAKTAAELFGEFARVA